MKSAHAALFLLALVLVASPSGGMAANTAGECSVIMLSPGGRCIQRACSLLCAESFDGGIGGCIDAQRCECSYFCM
ncbi:hypothetical protein PVAP13_1KG112035 [Panicum virgatum]|uniref:Defensin-like protein n=1 Tax=Panicum virgatum TaxID=38727 RepID=A0A8T0XKE1_PANVG|nr:hypothetical protein PVAP13_1KG112035 [Panicum virgatum]